MPFRCVAVVTLLILAVAAKSPVTLESLQCAEEALYNLDHVFPGKLQKNDVRSKIVDALARHPDICNMGNEGEANRLSQLVAQKMRKQQDECPQLPAAPATDDVCNLRPCNVGVVGAIGDSVTVGCNADSGSLLNMKDFPGVSWSMGGDPNAVTMPSILCDAEVKGKSTGEGGSKVMNLNHAVNGAVVQDMPGQASKLIADMKNTLGNEFETTWKVVTVFIGGNNLCEVCDMKKQTANDDIVYKRILGQTINMLTEQPRIFINVVKHLNYTQLAVFKKPLCYVFLPFVCECLTADSQTKRNIADEFIYKYNIAIDELVVEANQNITESKRKDVTVVAQPFLVDTVIPDAKYISSADCFHPSGLGQKLFGIGLWNNMIQPGSGKNTSVVPDTPIICPTEQTLLQCHN